MDDKLKRLREWAADNLRRKGTVYPSDLFTQIDKLLAEPEPGAPSMWLVQLARDTDEACAWERAFDHLILTMSRQGRLVGDEPERLGFLVRRGVQLMRQDHNEKNDDEADRSRDREPIPLPPTKDGHPAGEARRGDRGLSCAGEEAARDVSGWSRAGDGPDQAGGSAHVGEPVSGVRLADGRVAAPSDAEIEAAIRSVVDAWTIHNTDRRVERKQRMDAERDLRALMRRAAAEPDSGLLKAAQRVIDACPETIRHSGKAESAFHALQSAIAAERARRGK